MPQTFNQSATRPGGAIRPPFTCYSLGVEIEPAWGTQGRQRYVELVQRDEPSGQTIRFHNLTADQARELAARLVEAADSVEGVER